MTDGQIIAAVILSPLALASGWAWITEMRYRLAEWFHKGEPGWGGDRS